MRYVAVAFAAMLAAMMSSPVVADESRYPKMTIKFGDVANHDFPYYQGLVAFKKDIEEKTGGVIKVDILTDGALGNVKDVLQATQTGVIQMCDQASPNTQSIAPAHAIFDLPFLFKDRESWAKVAYGSVGDDIGKAINAKGVTFLAFGNGGGRGLLSKKPIATPNDLKGLKVRVLPDPLITDAFEALGAQPVISDPTEMYTALQQGVVDALDLTVELIVSYHLNEVGKYYTETKQIMPAVMVLSNTTWWNGLNKDTQDLIANSIKTVFRPASDARVIDIIPSDAIEIQKEQGKILTNLGITIVKPDIDAFRKATEAVRQKYTSKLGAELVQRIVEAQK